MVILNKNKDKFLYTFDILIHSTPALCRRSGVLNNQLNHPDVANLSSKITNNPKPILDFFEIRWDFFQFEEFQQ